MVNAAVFAFATGIGLLTDKYMLEATNFVEHYLDCLNPPGCTGVSFPPPTDAQKEFIKSAMYAGAIVGMVSFGPLSDFVGRRPCLIATSVLTLTGCLLSTAAWNSDALIWARIITGIGMGGEYPLASSHSAESAGNSGDGARNVALLYLFGSGFGPALCDIVTLILEVSSVPQQWKWRGIFAFGSSLAFVGLILRFFTLENSTKFQKAIKRTKGTKRALLYYFWMPLLGTAFIWFLFDVVEYGLKQNDAAIFTADDDGPYKFVIIQVLITRLLVIPSLALAPVLVKMLPSKRVQMLGFAGCIVANFILAVTYYQLKPITVLFDTVYVVQLSFQSLPGVTTMAIPAEIYPSTVKGTGVAISSACGKLGATFGSFYFTKLQVEGLIQEIFWTVTACATAALLLTMILLPLYNGATLDASEAFAERSQLKEAAAVLYQGLVDESEEEDHGEEDDEESEDDEEPEE